MIFKTQKIFQVIFLAISFFIVYSSSLMAESLAYLYDDLGRLTEVHFDNKAIIYTYDAVGNRTSRRIQSITDLKITLETVQTEITIGHTYDYTVTVLNQGPLVANNVTITLTPESNILVLSSDPTVCTIVTTATCLIGNLVANETQTFHISAVPRTTGTLIAQSSVSSNERDPIVADNQAEATILVQSSGIEGDTDGDGLLDTWEQSNGLDPFYYEDAYQDLDDDRLINLQEYSAGTDLNNSDTDGDGLPDSWEFNNNLDPLSSADASLDLDGDGLTNLEEYALGTNPYNIDTDSDGINDNVDDQPNFNPGALIPILNLLLDEDEDEE